MSLQTRLIAVALCCCALLFSACLSGNDTATPDSDLPTVAEPAAENAPVPGASSGAEDHADGEASEALEAEATEAVVSEAEETEELIPEPESPPPNGVPQRVEDAVGIATYRLEIITSQQDPHNDFTFHVNSAYIKEPPAEEILVEINAEGEETFEMGTLLVDGVRYIQSGDSWMETSAGGIHLNELTLIRVEDGLGIFEQMTYMGVEEVRGRSAHHYQGDKSIIPVVGTEGDTLDMGQADEAEIHLWIDAEYNVVSRLLLEGRINSEGGGLGISIDMIYHDFNGDVAISAPQDIVEIPGPTAVAPEELRGPISQFLGFNLLVPVGSNLETSNDGMVVMGTTPFTFEEAQNWLELNLTANGYTQLAKTESGEGQVSYVFQNMVKTVSITVSDDGENSSRIMFSATP